jgi:hypothetical protein
LITTLEDKQTENGQERKFPAKKREREEKKNINRYPGVVDYSLHFCLKNPQIPTFIGCSSQRKLHREKRKGARK